MRVHVPEHREAVVCRGWIGTQPCETVSRREYRHAEQMQQIRGMGGLSKLASMLPGAERAMSKAGTSVDEGQITRIEAMIRSMTKEERQKPKLINGQRRKRIAAGSGRSVQEVNQLIKQWGEMNKMMGKMRQMATAPKPTKGKKGKRGKGQKMSQRGQMRSMEDMMRQMGIDPRKMRF
ncbi:MAG: hypothetical protein IJH08_08005 [Atopobiaceae bacterium]|nr:hypothetical protein [Atopobiaceae bacterium]